MACFMQIARDIFEGGRAMISIPNSVFIQYQAVLKNNGADAARCAEYAKWLRYYLDFCAKHLIKCLGSGMQSCN